MAKNSTPKEIQQLRSRESRGLKRITLTIPAVCEDEFLQLAKLRRETYDDFEKYDTRAKFKNLVKKCGFDLIITGHLHAKSSPLIVKVKKGDIVRTVYNETPRFTKKENFKEWPQIAAKFLTIVSSLN